jgi:hypothetical protein
MTWHTDSRHFKSIVLLLTGATIWSLYAFKATYAGITHDEAGTFLNVIEQPINLWTCAWNPDCWRSANNHWLNSFLIRRSFELFDVSVFALRLPNILALVLYLLAAGGISHRYGKTLVSSLLIFCILVLNPYNLDFLALGRGYGLALGWTMACLYCVGTQCQLEFPNWKWLAASFLCATLAVFSNLTFVGIYAALCAWVCIRAWMSRDQLHFRDLALACIIPLCLTVLIAWFFYTPVVLLAGGGEFLYGQNSLWLSWSEYIRNSLYGAQYLGQQTSSVIAYISILAMAMSVYWIFRRRTDNSLSRYAISTATLATMMVAFFLLNALIFHATLPGERKAVVYSVFLMALVGCGFIFMPVSARWRNVISVVAIALIVFHFGRSFDMHVFREWYYDADTRAVVDYVSRHSEDTTYDLATEWLFTPSSMFYAQVEYPGLTIAPYTKEIVPEVDAAYYYVSPEHVAALETYFVPIENFRGRLLLKRRD